MPGFDGTGPQGMGPMTGRRMGRCVQPQQTPAEEDNPAGDVSETTSGTPIQQPQVYGLGRGGAPWGCGRGFGGGRGGRGRGRRW